MPPGFGVLDTVLVSIPFFLAMMGLIRGAPVELASCFGCLVGLAAAWAVGCMPSVQSLESPAGPLIALVSGVVAWRLARALSHWVGLDTRWVNFGRLFDSVLGLSMGALRGVALVSAGCLAYAMVMVPMGLANPVKTVAYPVFLAMGSRVTSTVIATVETTSLSPLASGRVQQAASLIPVPVSAPTLAAVAAPETAPGVAFAALVRVVAPNAIAATMLPAPRAPLASAHPDIPVRQVPLSLIETHHNILRPHGGVQSRHWRR